MFKFFIAVIIFSIVVSLFGSLVNSMEKLKQNIDEYGLIPTIAILCVVCAIFYYIYNSLSFWF